jgi:hypothetical protein
MSRRFLLQSHDHIRLCSAHLPMRIGLDLVYLGVGVLNPPLLSSCRRNPGMALEAHNQHNHFKYLLSEILESKRHITTL